MFEKVNPCHPDKVADRIAGAIVDLAYAKEAAPKIAVEVLIGHGMCHIISETSASIDPADVGRAVQRIAGNLMVDYKEVPQDGHLSENQKNGFRCGDNGIFKGMPVTEEQKKLSEIARDIFSAYPYDGKYILDGERLIIWQTPSQAEVCTVRTFPRLMFLSISTVSSKHRKQASLCSFAAPSVMTPLTADRIPKSWRLPVGISARSEALRSLRNGGLCNGHYHKV